MLTYDFSGRHAVVTGAGGGMGEAIALSFLKAGASVSAIDLKPQPATLDGYSERLSFYQGDVSDAAFVESTFAAAGKKHGSIDYLANVAGVLWFLRSICAQSH